MTVTVLWIAAAWILLPLPLAVLVGRAFARGDAVDREAQGLASVTQPATSSTGTDAASLTG